MRGLTACGSSASSARCDAASAATDLKSTSLRRKGNEVGLSSPTAHDLQPQVMSDRRVRPTLTLRSISCFLPVAWAQPQCPATVSFPSRALRRVGLPHEETSDSGWPFRSSRARAHTRRPIEVPVVYDKLPNGLKVVISEAHAAPTVTVAVYYGIGFRVEPKGQTGFAHLFEHMMFQGSEHVKKFEHAKIVEANGGNLNGSTRLDYTNYYETLPAERLETALWLEADRMRSLDVSDENLKNQQNVVSRGSARERPQSAVRALRMARPLAERESELVQRAQLLRRPARHRRGEDRRRAQVLQDVLRAEQRGADDRRRRRSGRGAQAGREVLRLHSAAADSEAARRQRAAADEREARQADRQAGQRAGARLRLSPARSAVARLSRRRCCSISSCRATTARASTSAW